MNIWTRPILEDIKEEADKVEKTMDYLGITIEQALTVLKYEGTLRDKVEEELKAREQAIWE